MTLVVRHWSLWNMNICAGLSAVLCRRIDNDFSPVCVDKTNYKWYC